MTLITFRYILYHIFISVIVAYFYLFAFIPPSFFCIDLHDILQFMMINSILLQTAFDFVKIFHRESFQKQPPEVFCRKRTLWHRCFPVNLAKFLRTPFLKEHLWATASKFLLDCKQHFKTRKEMKMKRKELLQTFFKKKICFLYQVSAISLY